MDETSIVRILSSPVVPLWAAFLVVLVTAIRFSPQWLDRWLAFAQQRRAAKDQDLTWLRDEVGRLAARVKTLEEESVGWRNKVHEVEEDRSKWMTRAIKAEAALDGLGEVRQASANAAAEIRLDAISKEKKGGGTSD